MMHGRRKSDSVVVAVKPTNKAERSAAEPVEPRAVAKGNAGHGVASHRGLRLSLGVSRRQENHGVPREMRIHFDLRRR